MEQLPYSTLVPGEVVPNSACIMCRVSLTLFPKNAKDHLGVNFVIPYGSKKDWDIEYLNSIEISKNSIEISQNSIEISKL